MSVNPKLSLIAPIHLQVGEQRFTTTRKTLDRSLFFSSLLSGLSDTELQVDGALFVDADGDLFQHILRYLRQRVFPLFYDNVNGHDHAKYLRLLGEAKYFQIAQLEDWLKNKRYLAAVKVEYSGAQIDDIAEINGITLPGTEVSFDTKWIMEKVYVCPRGLGQHRGNPGACGKACSKAQGLEPDEYEDELKLRILAIKKLTTFDRDIIVPGGTGGGNA